MLCVYKNGNIEVNKGDDFELRLFIDDSNDLLVKDRFPLEDNDSIIFWVFYPNGNNFNPILKLMLTRQNEDDEGNLVINFTHDLFDRLSKTTYYYQIQFIREIQDLETNATKTISQWITERRKFVIV